MLSMERVKGMVLAPRAEWPRVASDGTSMPNLTLGYVAPLSAIGPVAAFIGLMIFGLGVPFMGGLHLSTTSILMQSLVSYVLGLVGVFLAALLINALAPAFGAQADRGQAFKVAAYSFTPAWLAGVLNLVPALGMLAIVASLYSIYVLYLGLVTVMKAPESKAIGYCASVIVCAVIATMVTGAIVGRIGVGSF